MEGCLTVNEISTLSVLRHIAKRVREVEDALPTSCVWESMELRAIADDLEGLACLTDGKKSEKEERT